MDMRSEGKDRKPAVFDDFTCEWDTKELRQVVLGGTDPVVTDPATAFLSNIESVDALRMLPFIVAAEGVRLFYWSLKYARTLFSEASIEDRIAEANASLQEHLTKEGKVDEFAEMIDRTIEGAMRNDDCKHGYQIYLRSSLTLVWGAFE